MIDAERPHLRRSRSANKCDNRVGGCADPVVPGECPGRRLARGPGTRRPLNPLPFARLATGQKCPWKCTFAGELEGAEVLAPVAIGHLGFNRFFKVYTNGFWQALPVDARHGLVFVIHAEHLLFDLLPPLMRYAAIRLVYKGSRAKIAGSDSRVVPRERAASRTQFTGTSMAPSC